MQRRWMWAALIAASIVLTVGSWAKVLTLGLTEVLGFVTGAVCVLLVVEQNIWNFPIGLANNVFFIALFLSSRLYGDMGLQVVYIALGVHGWWQWLHGGANRTELCLGRTSPREWAVLSAICIVATAAMTTYLTTIHDSAPFLDGLTTVLSLIAQYLLNKKRIENWWVWIAADIIYIGLYAYKGLHLTSLLYAIFVVMCISGLRAWLRDLHAGEGEVASGVPDEEVLV